MPCRFRLNLPILGVGPSSKHHGSNLWLSFNRIVFGPSSKVAWSVYVWQLQTFSHQNMVTSATQENPKKTFSTLFALIFLCCCSVKNSTKKTTGSIVFWVFEITKIGGPLIDISAIKLPQRTPVLMPELVECLVVRRSLIWFLDRWRVWVSTDNQRLIYIVTFHFKLFTKGICWSEWTLLETGDFFFQFLSN